MKKIKKFVAVVLFSLTLFDTTFNSYVMTVQATEVLTMTVVEALLAMFGLELGLGNQTNFFGNSEFTDFVDAVADGRTVNMPKYGDVNFSDGQSILSWLSWANKVNDRVAGNNVVDVAVDTTILALAKALDKTSYTSTGSSATAMMGNKIDILKKYYDTATDFVGDVKDAFGTMIDKSDGKMTGTRWDIITGMMSTFMYGAADEISGLIDKLWTPKKTVYADYTDFTVYDGFSPYAIMPLYNDQLNPDYEKYKDRYVIGSNKYTDGRYYYYIVSENNIFKLSYGYFGVLNEDGKVDLKEVSYHDKKVREWSPRGISYNPEEDKFYCLFYTSYNWSYSNVSKWYIPIFEKESYGVAYYINGASVPILNLAEGVDIYPTFKEEVGINTFDISDMIKQLIDTVPSVDDITIKMPNVLDKTDSFVGTHTAVIDIITALADIGGILVDTQVQNKENTKGIIEAISLNWKNLFKWLDDFWTWLKNAWIELVNVIGVGAVAGHPNGSVDSGDSSSSSGFINLLNGLIMLISIFFILLRIFLHLLEFIINIFKIPADPGFITGDFAIGFEYIKSVQLTPLTISVYDFLMGLVHILVLFSVVKVLKKHIDRIHL